MAYYKGIKLTDGTGAEVEVERLHVELAKEQQKRAQLERELGEQRQKTYQVSCQLEVARQEIYQLRMQHRQDQSLIAHKTLVLQDENNRLKAKLHHYEHFDKARPEEIMRIRRENAIKAAEESYNTTQQQKQDEEQRKEARHLAAIALQAQIRAARKNPGKSYYERHALDDE